MNATVMRQTPAGGYGYNAEARTYQGPGPVPREVSVPCPWCSAGAWDDCVPRPAGTQHPSGLCYSRIQAYNNAHPDAWEG